MEANLDIRAKGVDFVQPEEIWAPIKGYEGLYEVSTLGRVKSLKRKKWNHNGWIDVPERILSPYHNQSGYCIVDLNNNGKRNARQVHRIVAETFLPNPENKPCIDHINTNRIDNRLINLRWCTITENYHNPLTSQNHKGHKGWNHNSKAKREIKYNQPHRKVVLQYSKNGILICEWCSIKEAERETGVSQSFISGCCIGYKKSAGGYLWKYKHYE